MVVKYKQSTIRSVIWIGAFFMFVHVLLKPWYTVQYSRSFWFQYNTKYYPFGYYKLLTTKNWYSLWFIIIWFNIFVYKIYWFHLYTKYYLFSFKLDNSSYMMIQLCICTILWFKLFVCLKRFIFLTWYTYEMVNFQLHLDMLV